MADRSRLLREGLWSLLQEAVKVLEDGRDNDVTQSRKRNLIAIVSAGAVEREIVSSER